MFEASNTPYVTVNLDQADRNILHMHEGLCDAKIAHRSHIKTHKSLYFAQRQLHFGAAGIAVSKLSEAEIMAAGGIDDIFIAHPIVSGAKLRRLGDLMRMSRISLLVNSLPCAAGLSSLAQRIGVRIPVLIEIDGDLHCGGVDPLKPARAFAAALRSLSGIEIVGLMHSGTSRMPADTISTLSKSAEKEREALLQTAALLRQDAHKMDILSINSPHSPFFPLSLRGLSEAITGDYIFGDTRFIHNVPLMSEDQCALRVHTTVVALHDDRNAVLDVGSKTLSCARCQSFPGYGRITGHPDWAISELYEEHAILTAPIFHRLSIGDRIQIIPNHCGETVNLQNILIGMRGEKPERIIQVDARSKTQ